MILAQKNTRDGIESGLQLPVRNERSAAHLNDYCICFITHADLDRLLPRTVAHRMPQNGGKSTSEPFAIGMRNRISEFNKTEFTLRLHDCCIRPSLHAQTRNL